MHYSSTVTKIKSLQQLIQIESDLHVVHVGDQRPEVDIVKMIENLSRWISTSEMDLEAGSLTTYLS